MQSLPGVLVCVKRSSCTIIHSYLCFFFCLKANKWCSQGIEMLGSQNIEKYSMFPEKVEQVLSELEQFVASADTFNVTGSDDLYVLIQDNCAAETKALVTQVNGARNWKWCAVFGSSLTRVFMVCIGSATHRRRYGYVR